MIALIQALEQAKGKRVTIFTDSRYAFSTTHMQGPIYQERGFQTAEGKEVKNLPEIRKLLEAVQLPQAVAIVHVPVHQKGEDPKAPKPSETIAAIVPLMLPLKKLLAGTMPPPY